MSSLSIRKLPRDVERAIQRAAKERGKTKTDIVVEALRDALVPGETVQQQRLAALKRLFGTMTAQEYREFKGATEVFEQIDEEPWH